MVPVPRASARVIVVNSQGKVLLFRFGEEATDEGQAFWLTPGGGVRTGETVPEAAVRELAEETGIVTSVEELGPVVAESRGQWSGGGTTYDAHDSFFFLRVLDTKITTDGQEELERSLCREHRWWGPGELRACAENVYPTGLARLVGDLLNDNRQVQPVELPWRLSVRPLMTGATRLVGAAED